VDENIYNEIVGGIYNWELVNGAYFVVAEVPIKAKTDSGGDVPVNYFVD